METSELLGVLCRELPGLRAVAEETGDGDGLEEVLAAARRGEPVTDRLRALGLLRLLESSTTRAAPAGGEQAGLVSLPGGDRAGHVALGRYRCPAGACRRAERPRPGDDLPVCALHARPLRFA
ncbi:hypothetical protein [Streptomyces albireticuli]|uniref:Uncharacterized protein n=1 Tax=Streptomyces albireticuli TaxID=1940 RepID=A0A2A2DD49_9ACTN|nr:hypothetical protein [Streptomyces albireticuli]MCD9144945.1 hypothetical protein [Streptomyces albireticuli]MCD9164371.1 hypothetical protein [Streptomyces albireticuli]MCD9194082.1 hypothetical protein [Streptomyces albireticuli]PAU49376.1 hypothetical protein CK936_07940 [Streptomyces albireticuli]